MDPVREIIIGNKGADYVSIKPRNRFSDGCSADIELRCDGWSGGVRGWFFEGELARFADEVRRLHRDLVGKAKLEPSEPNIAVTLTGDGKGHVRVEGEARNRFETSTILKFEFSIDQTYLQGIADALNAADPA